jgi:hypothetical protein
LFGCKGGGEEGGEFVVRAVKKLAGPLAGKGQAVAQFVEKNQRIVLQSDVVF